jgi:hypothetical protein
LANRHTYEVQKVQPTKASIEPCSPTRGKRGSCVLLHGWDADGSSMKPICTALHPLAAGWNLYVATYETHTETFVDAARDLRPAVAEQVIIPLDYNGYVAGWDPHLQGMNPKHLQPVLNTCSTLFK